MDWSKAKNILIVMFIIINIFIMACICKYYLIEPTSLATIDNTKTILSNRNFIVNCEIPLYNVKISTIFNREYNYDRKRILTGFLGDIDISNNYVQEEVKYFNGYKSLIFKKNSTFIFENLKPNGYIDIKESSRIEGCIKGFLKKLDLPINQFHLDSITTNENGNITVIFYERYKTLNLFDNYIKTIISKDGVHFLEFRLTKIDEVITGRRSMPIYQVLLKNLVKSSEKIEINRIELGFKEYVMDLETKQSSIVPVWRINFSNGSEKFFKSYSGEEIK